MLISVLLRSTSILLSYSAKIEMYNQKQNKRDGRMDEHPSSQVSMGKRMLLLLLFGK